MPGMTRFRASREGRQEALAPCATPLAPADLDVLAQKHEQAQVCFVVCCVGELARLICWFGHNDEVAWRASNI